MIDYSKDWWNVIRNEMEETCNNHKMRDEYEEAYGLEEGIMIIDRHMREDPESTIYDDGYFGFCSYCGAEILSEIKIVKCWRCNRETILPQKYGEFRKSERR